MRLVLRPAAVEDMRLAHAWYENKLPGLGQDFTTTLAQKLEQIRRNPQQFPVIRGAIRQAIVKRFPYSVFFVLAEASVTVLAVMHHAREPLQWQRRA